MSRGDLMGGGGGGGGGGVVPSLGLLSYPLKTASYSA